MTDNQSNLIGAGCGFYLIAYATWYFAHHRKTFLRTFAPHEALKNIMREGMRKRDEAAFCRSMKAVAALEAVVATIFWLVAYFIAV